MCKEPMGPTEHLVEGKECVQLPFQVSVCHGFDRGNDPVQVSGEFVLGV